MKTMAVTPNSSLKSTTTDSSYFPGCRKDANCKCDICIASINATLDLIQRSSTLTKISSSTRPIIPLTPVSFTDDFSTPQSKRVSIFPAPVSPPIDSTASNKFQEKVERRKKGLGYGGFVGRFVLGVVLVFGLEFGFSWVVCGVLRPRFSIDVAKNFSKKSRDFESLNLKFMLLKNELEGLIGKKVSSCGSVDSVWRINQDGLLVNSKCVLYESMAEEISIWGWPLQVSGLLTAEYSSRSFSVLSGRVFEWSSGEAKYLTRETNSSWTQPKWSSSVVQFDPNTWILEYRQSFFVENSRLVSGATEFLKFRLTRVFEKMKQEFWLLHSFGNQYFDFTRESSTALPT